MNKPAAHAMQNGVRLAHYEMVSLLGKGGMGEVWRATDTRLRRDVAVKFLPPDLMRDAERLARFDREARVLASLDDPRIAGIYGVEEADGQRFLVMQLAEGEDLSVRLQRGAIPLDESLEIARQIAEALEAAHEKGIVHRDLKPANIKIGTDGRVRVLDFGLARALQPEEPESDLANSPTMLRASGAGIILGTAGYMSPEQARGKRADRRADLWALGVVLWEMITGRRLFGGETVSDTLAAILKTDPEWAALPAETPPALLRLLRRCLERDPRKRLGDAAAARLEIEEAAGELARGAPPIETRHRRSRPTRAILIALAILAATSAVLWMTRTRTPPAAPLRLEMSGVSFHSVSSVAISPDGRRIAFVPYHPTARGLLHVRSLEAFSSQPIAGTEGASNPFFSPDGNSIGYAGEDGLYVVRVTGGIPQRIAVLLAAGETGVWADDGSIIFSGANVQGRRARTLMRVSSEGGAPQPVTKLEPGEQDHLHPLVVGKWVIFTVQNSAGWKVAAHSLIDGARRKLADSASTPQYLPASGRLLFFRGAHLRVDAAPFDMETGRLTTDPVPVLPNVLRHNASAHGAYAVARNGTLIYTPNDNNANLTGAYSLVWANRKGEVTPITTRRDAWTQPRLSPDGGTLLVRQTISPACTLWTIDLARGTVSRLTFQDDHHGARWHPSGDRIVSAVGTDRGRNIRELWIEPRGQQKEVLAIGREAETPQWSPDGRHLAFELVTPDQGRDIYMVDVTAGTPAQPFLRSPFDEATPAFSPDGRWLAYSSNESGNEELYVRPFGRAGRRVQISSTGGTGPLWSHDGRELFFAARDRMMAVDIGGGAELQASAPRELFGGKFVWERHSNYDVSADGQRFVMIQRSADDSLTEMLRVAVDWESEVKALTSRKK